MARSTIHASDDSRDIARGTIANALGTAASMSVFVFYLLLARFYGAAEVGLYLLGWTTVDLASKLGILGLDRAILSKVASRHAAGDTEGVYRLLLQALVIGGLASFVVLAGLLAVTGGLVTTFYHKPELLAPLRVMAWGLPFWTCSAIFIHVTRAFRIMRYEIIAKRVAEPLALLAFSLVAYWAGLGPAGLAHSFVASTAVGALLSVVFVHRELPLQGLSRVPLDRRELSGLFRYSMPIGFYDLLNQLMQRVDLFLIGRYLPTAAAGVYGLVQETAFTFKKVRQAFDPILIPVVAVAHATNDRANLQTQYDFVTRWVLLLNCALVGVALFAGPLILSLFGESFVKGSTAFVLLAFAVLINSSFGIAELFILVDRPALNVANSLAAALCSIALNLWMVPRFGIVGAAGACVIVYVGMNALRMVEVKHLYGLAIDPRGVSGVSAAALSAIGVGLMVHRPWGAADARLEVVSALVFLATYVLAWWYFVRPRRHGGVM